MYNRQSPHLHYGGLLEILFVPLHGSFYFMGGQHCRPFLKEHSLYIAESSLKEGYCNSGQFEPHHIDESSLLTLTRSV
jgi:hypothetical protein